MTRDKRLKEFLSLCESVNVDKTAVLIGINWADAHPDGFNSVNDYIRYVVERKSITNKEFIEVLQQWPEDALISIECCNPRAMVYDKINNLIRID